MKILNDKFDAFGSGWWDRFYKQGFHSYNNFDRAKFEVVYEFIKPGQSVIDFGFGEGYFFETLPERDSRTLAAVEWSPLAVAHGRERYPSVEFFEHDLEDPLYLTKTFDVGVCCEVLEHLKNPQALIESMKRCCKRIILTLPDEENCQKFADDDKPLLSKEFKENELDYHYAAYTRDDIKALLGEGTMFVDYPRHIIAIYDVLPSEGKT